MDGPTLSKVCMRQIGATGTVAICGVQNVKTITLLRDRAGYTGTVWCVEANPVTADKLRAALAPNASRVKLVNAVLCNADSGVIDFHINSVAVSSSIVKRKNTSQTVSMPALSLDSLLRVAGPLDCLIMDIEGAECGIVMGMDKSSAGKIKSLCVELHPNLWPDPSTDVAVHLRSLGYTVSVCGKGARPELSAVRHGKLDEAWQRFHDPKHRCYKALRRRFAWMCERVEGASLIDIGCSNGVGLLVASALTGMKRLCGVDASSTMVEQAKVNLVAAGVAATVTAADAEALPYPDASFDSAFMGELLEHVENDKAALCEALRVLRAGGRIIITVPIGGGVTADHVRTYDKVKLLALCRSVGISVDAADVLPSGGTTPWLCVSGRKEQA